MIRLTQSQLERIEKIHERWDSDQKISRFGNSIIRKMQEAVEDIAYLLSLVEDE